MGAFGQIVEMVAGGDELSQIVLAGTLIIFRVIPMTFLTPFLGGKLVPAPTKMGMSVGFAILIFPYAIQSTSGPIDLNPVVYIVLMLKELFLGFVIGFVASELFLAMEIGGRILDVMRGSNMAEVQVPELNLRASPLGDLLFQLLLVIFLAVGGHRIFIEAVVESFRVVPIDGWPKMALGFDEFCFAILKYTGSLFALAFALVFPGVFATFMTDVVFGMLNRVAPQLNAYFMAMGIKAMAGIALLFFGLGLAIETMTTLVADELRFIEEIVERLGA